MTTATTHTGLYRNTHWVERLVLSKLFWILAVSFLFAYPIAKSVGRRLPNELPVVTSLPRFSFFDEGGKSFGTSELQGKVYLAHFMSSDCSGQCDLALQDMKKVQHRMRGVVDRVAIVSFSIKPVHDTTEVRFAKARELQANPTVWRFVAGPERDTADLIAAFKVPDASGALLTSPTDVVAANQLVLVDQEGRVRGYYPIIKDGINKLMIDVGLLINRKPQS